jgi:exopolysaccharide production protein ExoQ
MLSGPGSANPNSETTPSSPGNWLSQLAPNKKGDGIPALSFAQDRLTPLKLALIALIALVMLGPLMTIVEGTAAGEGSIERQVGYILILGLTLYAIRPTATRASLIAFTWPLLITFAWCWLSLTWAIDPGVAVRRVFLTTLVAWMTFSLVRHAGYQLSADILRYSLLISVLISYVVVVADPMIGVHLFRESEMPTALLGNWRGFLGHKNFAGAVCALCIIMFLFDAKHIPRMIRAVAVVAAAYFLFKSQSKTSVGMLVLASLGGLIFELVNQRLRRYLIPMLTVGGSLAWFLTSAYADIVTSNFLSPRAFTGRGQIWSTLLRYSADHPILGAGFGSFWNIQKQSPVFEYGQGYVTMIFIGHSGYIDQLVTVGIPGVALMVFAMAGWPLARLLVSDRIPKGQGALIAAMLMFCIGHNVTESGLFERDGIVSTMFFFAVAFAHYATLGDKRVAASKQDGDDVMRALRKRARHRPVMTAGGAD